MKIPFVDLQAQYQKIKPEILEAIEEVLDSKKFIQGDYCKNFANEFIRGHGGNFGVGCSNGTSAITLALKAMDVGEGDEVITVCNTFFATAEAIVEAGAKPVFVDCLSSNYLINIDEIENKITDKTKAIIPVHLYGNPVHMEKLMEVSRKYNVKVLEDCAQAHLATFSNKAVGTFSEGGTFSFYPGKNLGAYGDAGLIISKNKEVHQKVCKLLDHGRIDKYQHDIMAGNYRMDAIQAAVLSVKLKYLREWTEKRIKAAEFYNQVLLDKGFKVIEKDPGAKCVYHLYIVEVENRDEVMSHLKDKGISTGIHYPIPLHQQPACSYLNYNNGDFPVAEKTAGRILSLPIYPEISEEQQAYILDHFFKIAKA